VLAKACGQGHPAAHPRAGAAVTVIGGVGVADATGICHGAPAVYASAIGRAGGEAGGSPDACAASVEYSTAACVPIRTSQSRLRTVRSPKQSLCRPSFAPGLSPFVPAQSRQDEPSPPHTPQSSLLRRARVSLSQSPAQSLDDPKDVAQSTVVKHNWSRRRL
jgi:hypothetical protein